MDVLGDGAWSVGKGRSLLCGGGAKDDSVEEPSLASTASKVGIGEERGAKTR